jgi:DNA modification methylase
MSRLTITKFNETHLNKVHKTDCLEFLKTLPSNCLDVIVTSPPYNMGNSDFSENPKRTVTTDKKNLGLGASSKVLSEGYSDFDDCLPWSVYIQQQRELITEMIRCIRPDGAIFYNTKWRIHKGLLENLHKITYGFPVRQMIIWNKYSTAAFSDNWFMSKYEVIYLITKGIDSTLKITKKGQVFGDVWDFCAERNNEHPAPFPVDLPLRCISSVKAGEERPLIVFDPYHGSGTTSIVAEALGHNWLGCDISDEYIEMFEKRRAKNKVHSELNIKDEDNKKHASNYRYFDSKEVVNVNKITF